MTAYTDLERETGRGFRAAAHAQRGVLTALGARAVPARLVRGLAGTVAHDAAWGLDDAGLLAVVASRPSLLDLDERAAGGWVSPRDALRGAVAAALLDGLGPEPETAVGTPGGGPEADEAARRALRCLDRLAAEGEPYPLLDEARTLFAAGEWDAPCAALALHACAFLAERGHEGPAFDLEAALDAVESPPPPGAPGPR